MSKFLTSKCWILLGLLSLGCGDPASKALQGRWLGDSLLNVDARYLASATGWARGMSFEFTGNYVTVTIPTELPRTAPYEVVDKQDDGVMIALRRDNGQVDMAHFGFVRPNTLRWDIGEGRAMLLRRIE